MYSVQLFIKKIVKQAVKENVAYIYKYVQYVWKSEKFDTIILNIFMDLDSELDFFD